MPQNKELSPPENENEVAPHPTSNRRLIILLVVLVVIGFSAASMMVGYMLAGKSKKAPATEPVPTSPAVTGTRPSMELEPTAAEVSAKPTLSPNPNGNTYRSEKLKLAFYYAPKMPGTNEVVRVTESRNTILLNSSDEPNAGQSVESFDKDPEATLEEAIEAQFLVGIDDSECFVKKLTSQDQNIEKAIIDYPVPENADLPFYEYGESCPAKYSRTNGITYFYYDKEVPDRFFFFRIGQYGIPAYSSDSDTMWQDTFEAY